MKIGIIGTGNIGGTLISALSALGHDVTAANSRGPQAVPAELLTHGAHAGTPDEAFAGADLVILSIPMNVLPKYRQLAQNMNEDATLIDTSNYYPGRDGQDFIPDGTVESEWVQNQLGRPIVKVFNTIGPVSLASGGRVNWTDGVIALPVSADRPEDIQTTCNLVKELGFDAHPAGPISQSWRQQPGNPAYGTDLTLSQLVDALAQADPERAPRLRDLFVAIAAERMSGNKGVNPPAKWGTELSRLLYME
ncbi:NADPH-dependent F420 reductase [Schaalia vaccimaxillae]|uniref:NADPH-dependent F420 reductase n=1 Tax=Schaalia vaccimaxillae TaxID=183916 RepID=UPI0003B43480|nr:NAD(P)-binding domain-containing protein [Schaalia vaccimaxillae]